MNQDRLSKIKKRITLIQLVSAPANIAIILGLYGVFIAKGDAFISSLNDIELCYGLIIFGGIIEVYTLAKLFPLWIEQSKIKKENVEKK